MPIYAYRCESCGHAKDVLQKMSDPVLSVCPSCGAESFKKQLTAAGFQLKGSGWYATDFRNNQSASGTPSTAQPAAKPSEGTSGGDSSSSSGGGEGSASGSSSGGSGAASASGGGTACGGSCACH